MPYFLNILYGLLVLAAFPWLLYKALTTGKYRIGMLCKFLGRAPLRQGHRPCAWFHAVSVGEVLLLKQVIAEFRRRHPHWDCVLSTTTNTGHSVALTTYPDLTVFYYPLDFTWAVRRALDRIRPSLVVLAELELWPNFIGLARRLGCAIAVINGRMSPRSLRGYRRIRPFMAWLLKKIDLLAVQNQDYAKRLLTLGAAAGRLHVTGSVKFDGVTTRRDNQKTKELGRLLGISRSRATAHGPRPSVPLVWVAGSTQEPEEEIVLGIYGRARQRFPGLRLILVPRHKERFDAVARLLERSGFPFVRRSRLIEPLANPDAIILLDTLGELSALWGLADLAFVGGSLTRRGGQNMIEPSGYGAAVTFGPHVWNFQDTADRLLECGGAIQAADAAELERETHRLLADAAARQHLGWAAQEFVQSQQGATDRTLALLDDLIRQRDPAVSAA